MADPQITLEIVTPEGLCLKEQVSDFTAPSVDGQFGVLPGHRPLLAALATGIVTYHRGGEEAQVAVGSGFVELADDRAVLLTDRFVRKADIDPVRARLELGEADEELDKLGSAADPAAYSQALARELWAAVQLELFGDAPPPLLRTHTELEAAPKADYVSEGLVDASADGAAEGSAPTAPRPSR